MVSIETVRDGVVESSQEKEISPWGSAYVPLTVNGTTIQVLWNGEVLAEADVDPYTPVAPAVSMTANMDCSTGLATVTIVNSGTVDEQIQLMARWAEGEGTRDVSVPAQDSVTFPFGGGYGFGYQVWKGDAVLAEATTPSCSPMPPASAILWLTCQPGVEQYVTVANATDEYLTFQVQSLEDGVVVYETSVTTEPRQSANVPVPFDRKYTHRVLFSGAVLLDESSPGCDVRPYEIVVTVDCSQENPVTVTVTNPRMRGANLSVYRMTLDGIMVDERALNVWGNSTKSVSMPWPADSVLRIHEQPTVLLEQTILACE